jgi:cell pole-organizing protein PopZ
MPSARPAVDAAPTPAENGAEHEPPVAPVEPQDALLMGAGVAPDPSQLEARPPAAAVHHQLVAPAAAAAAASSVDMLLRTLMTDREPVLVHRGGPTIEDVVREEVRTLLKVWLDANLPPMVERLVRSEIERVVGRATS